MCQGHLLQVLDVAVIAILIATAQNLVQIRTRTQTRTATVGPLRILHPPQSRLKEGDRKNYDVEAEVIHADRNTLS